MNARMPDHHSVPPVEGTDLRPFMERAREEIHEDLMRDGYWPTWRNARIRIEAEDYFAGLPVWEQKEVFRQLWPDNYGTHEDLRERVKRQHEERIREWIPEALVMERAGEIAEQEREEYA